MRQIIPKEIREMQDKCAPYMRYVEGRGVILSQDAPPEILAMKNKVDEWFDRHRSE